MHNTTFQPSSQEQVLSPKDSAQREQAEIRNEVIAAMMAVMACVGVIGYTQYDKHQTSNLQRQLAQVRAYSWNIDGKYGAYTHTGLVQFQAYCTGDLPEALGKYTQTVKKSWKLW